MIPLTRLYKDLDLSFQAHPDTGDVTKWIDVNAVKQSLRSLMLTQFFERPFQPQLGSPVYGLLFELMDSITSASIKQAIERLIQNYEPRVRLGQLDVQPDYDNNSYSIQMYFTVIGLSEVISFSTTLKRLR